MNREDCDWYEPKNRKSDKICRYFKGNPEKRNHIDKCRYRCSIMESKQVMEEDSHIDTRRIK